MRFLASSLTIEYISKHINLIAALFLTEKRKDVSAAYHQGYSLSVVTHYISARIIVTQIIRAVSRRSVTQLTSSKETERYAARGIMILTVRSDHRNGRGESPMCGVRNYPLFALNCSLK